MLIIKNHVSCLLDINVVSLQLLENSFVDWDTISSNNYPLQNWFSILAKRMQPNVLNWVSLIRILKGQQRMDFVK